MSIPPSGSRDEFVRAVLARYEADLFRYARRLMGDADAARDAVQETFLRLCRQEPALVTDRLPAWLYAVCRNHILDARRRQTAERLGEPPLCRQPGPPESLEAADAATRLLALVDDLPESQREVIHLKFSGGLSYREIGEVTGHSVSNVGFLIHRAVTTLRERLKRIEAGTEQAPGPRATIPLRKGEQA
jgi:RNA polymerase sigma-70 factor (ECF subfamily)